LSAKLCLKIETRADQLERLSSAIEALGEEDEWPPDLIFRVNLALEELGLNIINHGYADGCHEIEFKLTSEAESVTIEVTDDGKPFDPLQDAPTPDVTAPLEDRPVGGLGLHLVRTLMDEMRYRREGGRNHLTLVKLRAPNLGDPSRVDSAE
jgi:anti-sigma regulatory factor (Ser/Thr protein kinase)